MGKGECTVPQIQLQLERKIQYRSLGVPLWGLAGLRVCWAAACCSIERCHVVVQGVAVLHQEGRGAGRLVKYNANSPETAQHIKTGEVSSRSMLKCRHSTQRERTPTPCAALL